MVSFLILNNVLFAQNDKKAIARYLQNTSIYVDANKFHTYKNYTAFQFGIEQIIINKDYKITTQIGLIYFRPASRRFPVALPITLNQLFPFSRESHYFEYGLGLLLNNTDKLKFNDYTFRIGYRFRKESGHVDIRAAFIPVFSNVQFSNSTNNILEGINFNFAPGIGLGLGIRL